VFAQPGDSRLQRAASACSERPSRATCHGYMIPDRTSTDQASAVEMRAPLYLAYGLTLHAALQACRRSPVVAGRSPSSFESLPGDCLTV
jgi:hypothetical protein